MAQLGIKTDGTPHHRRLIKRTRRLNLYNKNLVSVDLTTLTAVPNLEILELGRNPLRTLDLAPLAHCPRLEQLVLTAETPVDLTPLSTCAELRSLHLYCRQWPALDLSPLSSLPHFESLLVHGGAFSILDLEPLASCPAFGSLSLHCPKLTSTFLDPLSACAQIEALTIQHTPLPALSFAAWPHLKYVNLLAVPLTEIDLLPLYASPLERFWVVKHALHELDLTPFVEIETLDELYFKPTPRLLLDDIYVNYPDRIQSPGVRECVDQELCIPQPRA